MTLMGAIGSTIASIGERTGRHLAHATGEGRPARHAALLFNEVAYFFQKRLAIRHR